MQNITKPFEEKLDLRPGDWVEVRAEAEILSTLDDGGSLGGLVFMPEMLAYCGRRFQVYKRAERTCDTVSMGSMRGMQDTVHLTMLRCDGSAHGGCQAECLLFWKEAWLRRCEPTRSDRPPIETLESQTRGEGCRARTREWLSTTALQNSTAHPEVCYRCQATEVQKASCPLPWWKPMQYVNDVRKNDMPLKSVIYSLAVSMYGKVLKRLTGRSFPDVSGPLKRTPVENLDLQPGEWVIVKSTEEIRATLDRTGRNRGMTFEASMIPYCGKRFRVLRRVEQIIEEATGRMKKLGGVSIILETVICASPYRRACPRANYLYWREIWLQRTQAPVPGESQDLGSQAPTCQVQIADSMV
jgi:hypothetical protein